MVLFEMSENMNIIEALWEPFINNAGFIITTFSFVIAILERQARIKAEKKQAELERKYNNLNNYIERVSLDEELYKDINRLKSEKGELEQQRDNLKKTIPEMAKESFAKYGVDLYTEQLLEDYEKYNQFKKMLDDNSTKSIPDDLVKEIEGLSGAKNNSETIVNSIIRLIGAIFLLSIWRELVGIPFLRIFPLFLCISPLIDIVSYYNADNDSLLIGNINRFLLSLFQVFVVLICVFFINIFQFLIADQFSMINSHMHIFRIIMIIVMIVLLYWGVYSYKNVLKCVFEINYITYSTISIISLFIFKAVLFCSGAFFIYNSELDFRDFDYFLYVGYDDYFVVGITLVICAVIGVIGEICFLKGNKYLKKNNIKNQNIP